MEAEDLSEGVWGRLHPSLLASKVEKWACEPRRAGAFCKLAKAKARILP